MWDVKACLACLSTDSKLEKITDIFQRLYLALTGIKSSDIDGYPMYFCVECHSQIRKALLFKRKCRRAYYVLKEIVNVKKQVTFNDITKVNRKRVNLESLISYSNLGSVDFFSIDGVEPDVETLVANLHNGECEEPKCDLVKEELLATGNIWHIDIEPSVPAQLDKPEADCEPMNNVDNNEDELVIANIEDVNDTNNLIKDLSEDVFNDNNVNEESEDEFPEPKLEDNQTVKKKVIASHVSKIGNKFISQIQTPLQITRVSVALSKADIRRLSQHEQIEVFEKAKIDIHFLLASYKCAMCLTVYKTMDCLIKHVMEHNKFLTSEHICDVCKTKFNDELDLLTHKAMYHLYEYKCGLCDKNTFYTMEKYIEHYNFHQKDCIQAKTNVELFTGYMKECFDMYTIDRKTMYEKLTHPDCRYECNVCNMKFFTPHYLETHMKRHTPLEKSSKCDICGIFTSSSYTMANHMNACHLYVFKCKICDDLLFNKQEAKYHKIKKHHPDQENSCSICGKKFNNSTALWIHRCKYHYSQVSCYHCVECGESTTRLMHLYKHQLTAHKRIIIDDPNTREDRFPCDSCNVKFLTLKSYQWHALKHRHEIANTFENACTTCKMLFDTAEEYQKHMTTSCKILNRYPRKCAYCELVMPNFAKYLRHHKRMHKGIPIWRIRDTQLCDLCGESVFDITDHVSRKHGFDLECRHCSPPEKLRDVWKYYVHMLTLHTPRPFVCALCLQPYATRRECKDHILKIHAPVNPFSCSTCNEEFSHADYLNEHCKKFLHPITEKPIRMRTQKKIYTYPHMKLNVSMFDPKVLDSLRLYLYDYGKTKREIIHDIKNYLVFDKQDELSLVEKMKPKKKRYRKKVNKVDLNLYKIGEEDYNQESSAARVEVIKKEKIEANNLECVKRNYLGPYESKLDPVDYDGVHDYRDIVFDEEDLMPPVKKKKKKNREKIEDRVEYVNDSELGLDGEKLNVIEQDGKQYVNINGILYEVVYEDVTV